MTRLSNWEGAITHYPAVIVRPRTAADLQDVVRDSKRYPAPVRAIGSGHHTSHVGTADGGTAVLMRGMDRILEIGSDYVRTEPGALFYDVAHELREHGLQFYVNVEIGNLTMGAAASSGTKDASMPGEYGQVNSYLIGMKLVTPTGELLEVTEEDADLLQALRSGYGLLGIAYEVTFRVRPLVSMSLTHESFTIDEFERRLPELQARDESMMLYIFPFLNSVSVEFRRYHDSEHRVVNSLPWRVRNLAWKSIAPGFGYLMSHAIPWRPLRFRVVNGFNRIAQRYVLTRLTSADTIATDQIIKYPETSGWTKYTFSIWAFPEETYVKTLRDYIAFVRGHFAATGFRCDMLNVGYRIAQDRSSLFSYTWNGPVMTVDPVSTGGEGWDDFLRAYNAFCTEHEGSPLFNQTKWLTREQVRGAFGDRVDRFERLRREMDPDDRMLNDYFRELLTPAEQAADAA